MEPLTSQFKLWKLPADSPLPNIPEFLPGMVLARKKGFDIWISLIEEFERDKVVAFFCLEERNTPRHWDWSIRYLYVLPRYRRGGVASSILKVLKKELRTLSAAIPEDNLSAQLLFKSEGFYCTRSVYSKVEKKSWYVFTYPFEKGN